MSKRRGFTIIELLVVVAILGILLGIISTAVVGSVKNGRKRRAEAMCSMLGQAIATYYQQEGRWPDEIESKAGSMGDKSKYTFTGTQADKIVRQIVGDSVGKKAKRFLIDSSALFVARSDKLNNNGDGCFDNHSDRESTSFCGNKHCINGVDFSIASNPKSKNHISIDNMAFGYAGTAHGKFCRFWITYNSQTDSVTVTRKHPGKSYPSNWE